MKNLAAEMYIIFRVRADAYSSDPPSTPQSRVYIKRSTAQPNIGEDKGTAANPKKRRRDKKRDGPPPPLDYIWIGGGGRRGDV